MSLALSMAFLLGKSCLSREGETDSIVIKGACLSWYCSGRSDFYLLFLENIYLFRSSDR